MTTATLHKGRTIGIGGWIGAGILTVVVAATVLAPWITGDPLEQHLEILLQAPSAAHPFGTDDLGRDLLTRTIHGGRTALTISVMSAVLASVLGLSLALAGALFGGWVDAISGRLADVQLAVPSIVLAIVVLSFVGNSFGPIVLVLVLGSWVLTFRVVRGHARAVIEQQYVEAARVAGAGRAAIAWRHLIPSVLPLLAVAFTLNASYALLLESSLGYLGLGVQPPQPDWGQMVAAGQAQIFTAPWIAFFPGLAVVVTSLGLQLLGDGLAERFTGGPVTRRGTK
ncbi:peptide/nickel transport system permease protein [Actinoplanes lutulentus]|uniref:Peptide/nickel transport system permease protein n=1 Tax=Actinoplanes lutulentus TaxID=1287878 RepID=A0A327ZL32_9ACTN|nr:ABC transporter permease [Actinoplanes lutulentus]MBB2940810.1 peptide/nickel transport system permease protein [Actinoplanes lutulentus]RAK43120.1 peptide/nickel transport system permease protein [Actinoplanes lutulentus]